MSIMEHYQKYVPTKTSEEQYYDSYSNETIDLHGDSLHYLLFGGDQLTVERACGSKKIRNNSERGIERLEGLVPVVEDWHARVALLKVSFSISTLLQLLNSSLCMYIGHLEKIIQNIFWYLCWNSLSVEKLTS